MFIAVSHMDRYVCICRPVVYLNNIIAFIFCLLFTCLFVFHIYSRKTIHRKSNLPSSRVHVVRPSTLEKGLYIQIIL